MCVFPPFVELERLKDHFQLLSALPVTTKSSLLQHFAKVVEDKEAVTSLQSVVSGTETQRQCHNVDLALSTSVMLTFISECLPLSQLDQMYLKKIPALGNVTTTESQKQNIQAILDLLEQSGQVESVLIALHLIVSAMDGEKTALCAAFIT